MPRLSYAVSLGIPCLTVVYLAGRATPRLIFFISAGVFLTGFGNTIGGILSASRMTVPVSRKRFFYHIFFTGVGILLGVHIFFTRTGDIPYTGIPQRTVRSIIGYCVEDSSRSKQHFTLIRVRLVSAEGKHGESASAGGIITVVTRGNQRYLWGERITAAGGFIGNSVFRGKHAERTESSRATVGGFFISERRRLLSFLQKKSGKLGKNAGSLFTSLFLGIRDDLGVREREIFRKAGCMHILALSGMHLGILSGLLFTLLLPVLGRRKTFWFTSAVIFIYLLLVGLKPSLLRAAVMFFLFGIGSLYRKKQDPLHILMVTCVIMAALFPDTLQTLSFQLSFLALWGLLYFGKRISPLFRRIVPTKAAYSISAAVGAQTASAPLLISVFGTIYPIGIIAGLVLGPLVAVFIITGMFYLLIPLRVAQPLLSPILHFLYNIVLGAARFFSTFPPVHRLPAIVVSAGIFTITILHDIRIRYMWMRMTRNTSDEL